MKKIVILLPFFLDGGVERAMINLSREMILNGIQVDFVFMDNCEGPLVSEIPKECRIIEFHKNGPIKAIYDFVKYLRREKPQVILAALTPANLLAIWGGRLSFLKIKIIVEVQVAVRTHVSGSPFRARFRPLVYKTFFRFSDYVVAVSKGIKADLESFGIPESKIKVIYNPISSTDIILKGDEPVNHPYFANKDIPVIIAVGRLHKQKDFPLLLRAFKDVCLKREVRLIILGEGEERKNLELLIKNLNIEKYVDLAGFVVNPYSFMKKSSLFVLSSAWEGFGNVLAEAMSFGVPLVSTDCPWGPREILEDGKYGELVPVGDKDSLVTAIIKTLDHKHDPKLELLSAERFKADYIFKQYINLINS